MLRAGSAASPAARSTAITPVNAIAWFFGEKASIDGGITVSLAGSRPSQMIGATREHVGVRPLDVGDQEPPSFAREVVGRIDAHV